MNKHELIARSRRTPASRNARDRGRGVVFRWHHEVVEEGATDYVRQFWHVQTAQRKASTARNPQTGAAIKVRNVASYASAPARRSGCGELKEFRWQN